VIGNGGPTPAFEIRDLPRSGAEAAVSLYCRVMSDQFLASCGRAFLRNYFQAWIESPVAIALVAVSREGLPIAMLLGAVDPAQHYRWMLRDRGGAMAARLIVRAIHCPRWGIALARTRSRRYLRGLVRMVVWTQRRRQRGVEVPSQVQIGEVTHLMVAPEWRGQGLGSALLSHAQQLAIADRVERLVVVTPVGWTSADFYTGLGWTEEGEMVTSSDEHFLRFELALASRA
jgi:GNAT superfamily N-acetyltransferase